MKEIQRAETEKRSSARLGYFLAGLAILLVASAWDEQTKRVPSVRRRGLELRKCTGQPKAH